MRLKLLLLTPVLGVAGICGFSQDDGNPGPFSFSFAPGNSPESQPFAESGNSGTGPWQSIGGFNFGIESPETSSDLSWHSHVNVTEFQSLFAAGISSVLWEADSFILSGQALGGYAYGHNDFADSWHGSFDLFGATALGSGKSNFLKLGAFVDVEEDFGKWGPEVGLLLGADKDHPVTLDVAYGQGIGDEIALNNSVWSVAEHDVQMRAGVFLNQSLQVGLTGQLLKWDDMSGTEEDWRAGGFMNYYSDKGIVIGIGAASGEHGTSGFASVSFTRASRSYAPLPEAKGGKEVFRDIPDFAPRAWMTSPVRRLQAVEVRQVSHQEFAQTQMNNPDTLGGNVTGTFFVDGDPNTRLERAGGGNRLRVIYTNTTNLPQTVTIVSVEDFAGNIVAGPTATVAGGSTLVLETGGTAATGPDPFVRTAVISVNGQTFSADLVFPLNVTSGFTTAPISIP